MKRNIVVTETAESHSALSLNTLHCRKTIAFRRIPVPFPGRHRRENCFPAFLRKKLYLPKK